MKVGPKHSSSVRMFTINRSTLELTNRPFSSMVAQAGDFGGASVCAVYGADAGADRVAGAALPQVECSLQAGLMVVQAQPTTHLYYCSPHSPLSFCPLSERAVAWLQ